MILLFRSASLHLLAVICSDRGSSLIGQYRVFLHATDESALSNGITMDALKRYAAEGEAAGGGGSLERKVPVNPNASGSIARETH